MSLYRKAFLIWWTALVVFVATSMYVNRDVRLPVAYGWRVFAGVAVMIFALGSWLPSAFLRSLRP
jgi:hypothetical protein